MLLYNDTRNDQGNRRNKIKKQKLFVRDESQPGGLAYSFDARPAIFSRFAAECIDRAIAIFIFTFMIAIAMILIGKEYFVPMWLSILFVWNLLRDCSPNQRSIGKRIRSLRVVMSNGQDLCPLWRRFARRIGSAISQLFYFLGLAMLLPLLGIQESANSIADLLFTAIGLARPSASFLMLTALIYDIVSLITMSIDPKGRRIEDLLTRTRVITESAYLENRIPCTSCHRPISLHLYKCQYCGERNHFATPTIKY